MTEAEANDLQTLRNSIADIQIETYAYMKILLKTPVNDLQYTGHKTVGEAMIYSMQYSEKKIKNLQDAFLRKYPDQK